MSFHIEASCACNAGRIRENNEDNIYFNGFVLDEINQGLPKTLLTTVPVGKRSCFAVFDGMGGQEKGEKAARTAAEALGESMKSLQEYKGQPVDLLVSACKDMNDAICKERAREAGIEMGATLVMLMFFDEKAFLCNIGDSRGYFFRDGKLSQITTDHVERVSAALPVRKPSLTQHLGLFRDEVTLEPYIAVGTLRPGDVMLLCSDGLYDMLDENGISSCLAEHENNIGKCVETLIERAVKNGGRDNVTAMIIKAED